LTNSLPAGPTKRFPFAPPVNCAALTLRWVNPPPLPLMTPAMNVWLWPLPMRMMLVSVERPWLPMSMLELPVVMFKPV